MTKQEFETDEERSSNQERRGNLEDFEEITIITKRVGRYLCSLRIR